MGLSFSVKLAFIFRYFERLWYYPLHYTYKPEIRKFCCHFFWLKKLKQQIKFLYDIEVTFYVFLPWIFLSTIGPSGGRSPISPPPPLGTRLAESLHTLFKLDYKISVPECTRNPNEVSLKKHTGDFFKLWTNCIHVRSKTRFWTRISRF